MDVNDTQRREVGPPWGDAETLTLLELAVAHRSIVYGQYRGPGGPARKDAIWQEIVDEVNAVSAHVRTKKICETRLRTYTSNVKNKKTKEHNRLKKTGGGELLLDDLTPVAAQMHRLALVYLGVDRLEGVPGGGQTALDTEDEDLVEDRRQEDKRRGNEKKAQYEETRRQVCDKRLVGAFDDMEELFSGSSKKKEGNDDSDIDSVIGLTPVRKKTRTVLASQKRINYRLASEVATSAAATPTPTSQPVLQLEGLQDTVKEGMRELGSTIALAIVNAARYITLSSRDISVDDKGVDCCPTVETTEMQTDETPPQPEPPLSYDKIRASVLAYIKELQVQQWIGILTKASSSNLKSMRREEEMFTQLNDYLDEDDRQDLVNIFKNEGTDLLRKADSSTVYKSLVFVIAQMMEAGDLSFTKTSSSQDSTSSQPPSSSQPDDVRTAPDQTTVKASTSSEATEAKKGRKKRARKP